MMIAFAPEWPEVVEPLVGHPAGERAVAEHRDDVAMVLTLQVPWAVASPWA